jgi:ParB/RepB/Spo0J family partition protein
MTIVKTPATSSVTRVELDPRSLLVDVNIRTDAQLDKAFIASIKDFGVLVPITAVRTTGGEVRVRFGHRRTLAAIEAELATMPVEIVGDEATDDAAQIERILTQHAENAHRAALTSSEQLGVVEQLSAFGMSAAQIAKRTKIKRGSVDASLAVASSDLAKAAAERYDFLTLEQGAAVAEFDNDPDAVKKLVVAAQHGRGFDHLLQRLREDRADQVLIDAKVAELLTAGMTIIDRPKWTDAAKDLETLAKRADAEITPESHAECPGHLRTSRPFGTSMRTPPTPMTTSDGSRKRRTCAWIQFSTATSKLLRNPHVAPATRMLNRRRSAPKPTKRPRPSGDACSTTTRRGAQPRPYGVSGSRTSSLARPHRRRGALHLQRARRGRSPTARRHGQAARVRTRVARPRCTGITLATHAWL